MKYLRFPVLLFVLSVVYHCQSASAKRVTVQTNVQYGTASNIPLLMDIYEPAAHTAAPCIVLIHGGGWVEGDKAQYISMGKGLAADGFVAASIDYRMLPKFPYPAALDDSQLAVRFLRANASKYGINPSEMGALGDSAGGYLVALLGLRDTRDTTAPLQNYSSKVQAVVDFYGPSDFTVPAKDISPLGVMLVNNFLNSTQAKDPALFKSSSPITYVSKGAPPFLILQGTADTLVPFSQSSELYNALKAVGADVTLFGVYGAQHAFLTSSPDPGIYLPLCAGFFSNVFHTNSN